MNIAEALDTVSRLKRAVEELDKALKATEKTEYGAPAEVSASVFVHGAGTISVSLDRDSCIRALQDTKNGYEARIAKLQPVIDMANAALKGVLT